MSTPKGVTNKNTELAIMGIAMAGIDKRTKALREQFGLSQSEMARRCGEKPQTIQKLEAGTVQRPRYILELAKVLKTTPDWLLKGTGEKPRNLPQIKTFDSGQESAVKSPQPPVSLPPLEEMPRDVPVLGTARGGSRGAFELNHGDPIDFVRRPPGISGAKDVYCIYVEGNSMTPRFQEGELVYVHPGRKIKVGDFVIIEQKDSGDKPAKAFIKKLKRRTETKLVLQQFNPTAVIEMPMKTIKSLHLILTMNDLFGV